MPTFLPNTNQVVTSFIVAAVITTSSSIIAAVLDGIILDEKALLPHKFQKWLHEGLGKAAEERCLLWRKILDRLILAFADQQLVTGISLLVSGYIKGSSDMQGLWHYVNGAHFSLIVYLSCLSSSSHLACVLTLRKYFQHHHFTSILRVAVIGGYALFLSVSIGISRTFEPFFMVIRVPLFHILGKLTLSKPTQYDSKRRWIALELIPAIFLFLYLFWIAVVPLKEDWQGQIAQAIRDSIWPKCRQLLGLNPKGILRRLFRKILRATIRTRIKVVIKKLFWYCLFPSPGTVFLLQVIFALVSVFFGLVQKFAKRSGYCNLSGAGENTWSFGQTLPMFLLLLPLLSAAETYFGKLKAFDCSEHTPGADKYLELKDDLEPQSVSRPQSGHSLSTHGTGFSSQVAHDSPSHWSASNILAAHISAPQSDSMAGVSALSKTTELELQILSNLGPGKIRLLSETGRADTEMRIGFDRVTGMSTSSAIVRDDRLSPVPRRNTPRDEP
jgi:hypothetical protein